jgi:two-component system OmpR family sensor kinase
LVLTAVALVLAVSVLIGAAATLAIHSRLTGQVDDQLIQTIQRLGGPGGGDPGNTRPGTVQAGYPDGDGGAVGYRYGLGPGSRTELDDNELASLRDVPVDGEIHTVEVTGSGGYRAKAVAGTINQDGGRIVVALPTADVDEAVRSLIGSEALLITLGALLAAGGGLVLVRRQLRPLNEVAATAHRVAALPLAEGEIDLTERVPERLTDERTEVGQVGAALNTLLEHVGTSLAARHRSEQQVRQFVADASHELRTPLATIAGYTELARRRPDDLATVGTALGKVEEESGRMTSLVEDLLLLARLDAGRPLAREPVDLTHLLLEAVSDARVLAPDHQWRLELLDEPLEVTGDEQRLHQVVANLLTNARKHTPPGTMVTVTGRRDGFEVHDDGPGLPPDFVAKAFERFARVDGARERTGGAGLGLALVEAIVRSHGGTVRLQSAPRSTTIVVSGLGASDSVSAESVVAHPGT